MSDLQIGLLAVGVLVVAGIFAYNALQERRARRTAERAFGSAHADVLMDGAAQRLEPRFDAPGRRAPAVEAAALPDARLDYIIELQLRQVASAAEVAAHWAPFEHRFAGRARLAASPDRAAWRPLSAAGSCAAVRAALQLASRGGPVTTFSKCTCASVDTRVGVMPALPSPADRAIEKQPAWAAATSSSGLVPVPLSNRDENEYWPS
jgi:hypothetical protein